MTILLILAQITIMLSLNEHLPDVGRCLLATILPQPKSLKSLPYAAQTSIRHSLVRFSSFLGPFDFCVRVGCVWKLVRLQYITVSGFVREMLEINSRRDTRISQCFPNDPYSNLCIVTTTQKLYLQHAFLSMDSGYFARIDPDTRQVDLRELEEEPLVRVLHSLYGQELVVQSVAELGLLLPIILYLEIQQYRKNIERQILDRPELRTNVALLELSFRYQLCWAQVVETHVAMDLAALQDSRSFLQIGKLSSDTFNTLLEEYMSRTAGGNPRTLNNVMENYFNKKGIKPAQYLQSHNLIRLLAIWVEYHHSCQQLSLSPDLKATIRDGSTPVLTAAEKRVKIKCLESEIKSKDEVIGKMMADISKLKAELGIREKLATAKSMLVMIEEVQPPAEREEIKEKEYRRSKLSPQFRSCIYDDLPKLQRRASLSKKKTFNRFGSKNLKKWA